jgi:SanA protein
MGITIPKYVKGVLLLIGTLFVGAIIFLVVVYYEIEQASEPYIYQDYSQLDQYDVGLVLGTSRYTITGKENPYFTYRIDSAESLYRKDIIRKILVSGDNQFVSYNEPKAMQNALIERGIPVEDIVLDFAGFRTLDSVVRAREVFGQSEFLVISQPFHVKRAIYIGREYGIDIKGYYAEDIPLEQGLKVQVREIFARAQAWIDIHLLEKQPRFLGEPIDIDNTGIEN